MDILNWLYMKTAGLVKTTANDPSTDLVALGANVGFNKRDDQYQTYAMPLKDAVQSGLVANTAHYELDMSSTSTVTVNTTKGIIDIIGMGTNVSLTPARGFGSTTPFYINNPELDLTVGNRDNVYVQYSVYYSQGVDDNAIPYLISTGVSNGLGFNLYNANPVTADTDNWQGSLYVYFELYQIN
jgi:hypothetical protein